MDQEFTCASALGRRGEHADPDPYQTLALLRSDTPVCPIPQAESEHSTWFVTAYDLARKSLADSRLSLDGHSFGREPYPGSWLASDPPRHTRLRRLVVGAFSTAASSKWSSVITEICDRAIEEFIERGHADLVREYALPVPVSVIHAFLGVPEEICEDAEKCMDSFFHAHFVDRAHNPAKAAMEDHARRIIDYKRSHPGSDLTTSLLRALADGEVKDEAELCGMIYILLGAGHLSTVPLLSAAIFRLLENPGQLPSAESKSSPSYWQAVVEEALRYDSAVQTTHTRMATSDLDLGGTQVHRGDTVSISLAAANRDPAVFADPENFDVGRPRKPHIAFGYGIHLCVGAPLARLEAEIALKTLFGRVRGISLDIPAQQAEWVLGPSIRGVRELPVSFEARGTRRQGAGSGHPAGERPGN